MNKFTSQEFQKRYHWQILYPWENRYHVDVTVGIIRLKQNSVDLIDQQFLFSLSVFLVNFSPVKRGDGKRGRGNELSDLPGRLESSL